MKVTYSILLVALTVAACGQGQDNKPILEKDRQTLEQAKKVDNLQQQNADQQRQAVDQQAQ